MWLRIALWPWLVRWLAYSATLAPFLTAYVMVGGYPDPAESGRWHSPGWWTVAAVAALALGLLMSVSLAFRRERIVACLGGVTADKYGQVATAATRGPVPADPVVRVAAGRLARFQADGLRPLARIAPWLFALCGLLQIPDFLDPDRPVALSQVVTLAIFAALPVFYRLYPRLLDARAQLLLAAPGGPASETWSQGVEGACCE